MCPKDEMDNAALTASHTLEYSYKRSLGPVLSKFFTALRDRRFLGIRRSDGTVMVPPKEYDPDTGEGLSEWVDVSDRGVVKSWVWVREPRPQQPLDHAFAYALVLLDGSDTPFLHVIDAVAETDIKTGMRVRAQWIEETTGVITDFVFVPDHTDARIETRSSGGETDSPVKVLEAPISLDYAYSAGQSASRFLRAIEKGKLLGQRCPVDGRVYFPSRGACPQHAVTFGDEVVELSDKGTVVTFSVVRVPSANIPLELPYVAVNVLLDGSDTILMHVLDANPNDVKMGMRVQAIWKPKEEWTTSTENIMYFRAIDEPEADYESYKEHI